MKFNPRHKLFCQEYIKDFNATRAYAVAYNRTHDETSQNNGHKLLRNTEIQDYIKDYIKNKTDDLGITNEYILRGIKNIADTAYKVDNKGCHSDDFNAKNKAFEMLGKYKKLFTEKTEITGKDGGPIETCNLTKEEYIKIREEMLKNDDI